jgi:hypothetical protein
MAQNGLLPTTTKYSHLKKLDKRLEKEVQVEEEIGSSANYSVTGTQVVDFGQNSAKSRFHMETTHSNVEMVHIDPFRPT